MMKVDGVEVPASGSLLDACRAAGAEVTSPCHHPLVEPAGHCRGCVVEADGRLVAACTTPATDGVEVRTTSDILTTYRRDLSALSPPGPDVVDTSHRYLRIDLRHCILCRLCVRACAEVQAQFVFAVEGRGADARIGWGGGRFADSACVSCGLCVQVCPTDALTDVDRGAKALAGDTAAVRTTCSFCGVGCQLDVVAREEAVGWIDGADAAVNRGHLCAKGRYAHGWVRHPDRLDGPLLRRGDSLEPVSWEDALAAVGTAFAARRGKLAALSSSRCTNEENYLVQKWFRAGLGTHNVDCCARVCHAPTATGMQRAFGTGAATNSLTDIALADVLLVAGSNATEAHPVTGARIVQAALAGAHLIVIDPRRTRLAQIADVHLQLRPGTNVALLNSLAAVLVEERFVDMDFVRTRTSGWEGFADFIAPYGPERMESVTGVCADTVRRAARLYGAAARGLAIHGLGLTEHFQGSESVMTLCNLALLTGNLGRPGVGINPLRGQNNVQGAADMGCQPNLMTGYADPDDPAVRAHFAEQWGRPVPTEPGLTLPRMYQAALRGDIRGLYILGEDVVQTDPTEGHTIAALNRLDILVVQELFLSETARLADVVLPGASFLEKDGTFTNGERRVQRVRKVLEPRGARADWEIIVDLMGATGYPQQYGSPAEIMDEIARVAPMKFGGVSYTRLDDDGLQWPVPEPGHPGTSILHTGATGLRINHVPFVPSPSLAIPSDMLLITGRVLEHYNSGSMTRRSGNVDLRPCDELEMHPKDAEKRGVATGDAVVVESSFGQAHAVVRVTDRVAPGTAFLPFHFPETHTNAVTTDVLDRLADCPEYKLTPVAISKSGR